MVSEPTLEFDGSVTPSEDIDTVPVPSEEMVAPPKSIVCPARNNSLNLLDEEPKFLRLVWSGTMSCATAVKSTATTTTTAATAATTTTTTAAAATTTTTTNTTNTTTCYYYYYYYYYYS